MSVTEDRLPDVVGAAIVLVGDFNPKIFQPFWFSENGLVSPSEAEDAEPVITPDFVDVTFDWFTLQAFRERVVVATREETESPRRVRDLVADVFRILRHTPIKLLGMNHQAHLWLREGGWSRVEAALTPSVVPLFDGQQLSSWTVAAPRDDGLDGNRRLTVEPSARYQGGAWVQLNSHVDLGDAAAVNAERAVVVIEEFWEGSAADAQVVMDRIRQLASA